jgi:hypothetical protein
MLFLVKHCGLLTRANSFRFFSVKIPLKTTCLEEKIHHEVKKVEVRKKERGFVRELIRLFRLGG